MPAYHVQRSIVIQASPEKVFDTVADYRTWASWSPWLGVDKEAKVTVSDVSSSVGSLYKWSGELVGVGELEHSSLERPTSIVDEIRFFKPFKSTSKVRFALKPQKVATEEGAAEGTEITWHMQGKLPWFLFWMKSNMEVFIGLDYERGLKMLREFIETGTVLSDTEVLGVETVKSRTLFGHANSAALAEIGPAMEKSLKLAVDKLTAAGISTDGEVLSVYHPGDLKSGSFDFVSGCVVDASAELPSGLQRCELPAEKVLHLRHTGSYGNLGNAWSGAYQYARYTKLKLAKRDSYEIYRNDPCKTAEADLVTDIYLPTR